MGILDAPTLIRSKVGASVTAALANNQRDVNMWVGTDSTGVDLVEQSGGPDRRWVYLLTQLIGQDFPAYTVQHCQWNATNNNFDAATVIQTGTGTGNAGGPFVFTVWGAAKSGATASYWVLELATYGVSAIFPAAMDLILLADGHNEVGKGNVLVRPQLWNLHRAVSVVQPGVPIVWVTQNPQYAAASASTTTSAEQSNQLTRMEAVRQLARSEGVGLIDVQPAFLANPNYGTALMNTDGVHPNPAGSAFWAAQAKQHFPKSPDMSGFAQGGPIAKPTRLWLPAAAFSAVVGAPTLTTLQQIQCWSLPESAQSIVGTSVDIPVGWQQLNVYIVWATAAASSGFNWRGRVGQLRLGGTYEPASASGLTLVSGNIGPGTLTTIAGRTANQIGDQLMYNATNAVVGFTGRPMMFQMERLGTDAGDTYAGPVSFLGMWFERAA